MTKPTLKAPLNAGQTVTIRNKGRYTPHELAVAFDEKTPIKFFGMECIIVDLQQLFFDEDYELKIKANK